ncbi:hypothetical protein GRI89_07880 [Altererythrobacter salegens]|uniref:SnoaL-like domain-containing protein n=1 Tax=Croceibacterium salegens TaxID=1737568 RepID=A0A6I4SVT9_9SPHN|nr:nuclear transport factor 2 family protein [Croceibacterium salegens]MXO59459.1 hypothetical protein [Croceibacterium salegens]
MIRRFILPLALLAATPAAAQDTARETAQVEDLRSIREIKRLQAEWGYYAMAGDWKAMAALGTDDVEMVLPGGNAVGRDALDDWLRERMGQGADGVAAGRLNVWLYVSPVITLSPDGQRATGRWHHIALLAEAGKSADWIGTTDVIEYRKTGEGWRIAHIRPYLQLSGPYDPGFGHDATTLERAPYHYSPDEAGVILPERRAAEPRLGEDLASEATLLLRLGMAQNRADQFGFYLDRGMYDDIVDLFAPDATIDVAGQGTFSGHAGVRKFLARFGAPGLDPGELNDRPQLMPEVSISDDGATALVRTTELGMTGQHGGEGYWSVAVNTFLLTRGDDGKWRIAMLHRRPVMRSTYKHGWAQPLPAALPPGEGVTFDGEPQPVDTAYPEHAFHMQMLGSGVVYPARGERKPLEVTANALAMAESWDGAENVSNAYGYYIDQFAWDHTSDLFARDGWKELSYIGTFIGRDHVRASMVQRYGEGGPNDAFQAIHMKTQPVVTVEGDGSRAFIRERLMQFNSSASGPGSWIGGIYENQVIKEDGVWKIAGMDLDYTWLADYKTGWTGIVPGASSRFGPSAEVIASFHPDAPLRGPAFAPYPESETLGFDYANPVSGREPPLRLRWSDEHREEQH